MKKTTKYYEKILLYLISLIFIVILSILIYKKFDKERVIIPDNHLFSNEYKKVSEDNLFVYSNSNEIINILEKDTGVIYIGFKECNWCQYYVPILNEIAKEEKIDKIYYLDILEERKNNTTNYLKIVNLLNKHLISDDEGNKQIYCPNVTIVKNGKIIGNNNETSIMTENNIEPKTYWTNIKKEKLKLELKEYFKKLNE